MHLDFIDFLTISTIAMILVPFCKSFPQHGFTAIVTLCIQNYAISDQDRSGLVQVKFATKYNCKIQGFPSILSLISIFLYFDNDNSINTNGCEHEQSNYFFYRKLQCTYLHYIPKQDFACIYGLVSQVK